MPPKPCSYEDHESSYWRMVGQVVLVCGVCHPVPLPLCCRLDTKQEGFWTRKEGFVAIEYPEPEGYIEREIIMEKLRRPKTKFEADLFVKDLGAAFDRLGVDRGAEFVLARADNEAGVAVVAAVEKRATKQAADAKPPESAITGV